MTSFGLSAPTRQLTTLQFSLLRDSMPPSCLRRCQVHICYIFTYADKHSCTSFKYEKHEIVKDEVVGIDNITKGHSG